MSQSQSQCSARLHLSISLSLLLLPRAVLVVLTFLLGFCSPNFSAAQDSSLNAGFLFDRSPLTLETGIRTEAFGPFFYDWEGEQAHTWAVPPLFSHVDWLNGQGTEYDFIYPILTFDRYGDEYRWHIIQLFSFSGGQTQTDEPRHRFSIFPFYMQQRSSDTNQNYTALFPIYGHLKNRLFRSEVDFVLWPIYIKTVKRPSISPISDDPSLRILNQWLSARRGDVTTYNYVYPFFHLRYGDGLFGWQFWPLFGNEHKDVTTKTNAWGELEQTPGHDKMFVLWPFYEEHHRNIGTPNPENEYLFFPFYGQLRSPLRDSTSYLTPFGLTLTDDRARKYKEVDCPWPIIVFAWGEGKTTHRVWPFFSQARSDSLESDFYLWPAYTYKRKLGETLDRERTRSFFFLFSNTKEKNRETGKERARIDVWPLFTHRRDFEGRTRLQLIAPLEPLLPASESIARNYSPLWSIWRSENNPVDGASSQSFLWNLYHREVIPAPTPVVTTPPAPPTPAASGNFFTAFSSLTTSNAPTPPTPVAPPVPLAPPTKKVSLLFGLFQYESTGENLRWRLFYLPLYSSQKESQHVPEHR